MSKVAIEVDRNLLAHKVLMAEQQGPLPSLSELFKVVAHSYNADKAPVYPNITYSIVQLRVKEWGIQFITQPGKRGLRVDQKEEGAGKSKRSLKMANFTKTFERLNKIVPEKYKGLIKKVQGGSQKAAIKLKCLDCSYYDVKEIKNCACSSCPLFPVRPFQKIDSVEISNETGDATSTIIMPIATPTEITEHN